MQNLRQRFGLIFALTAILLTLAGCGNSVVGKWDMAAGAPGGGKAVTEFKGDNTFHMNLTSPMLPSGMTLKGTYKLEGDKLTMTPNDLIAPGIPPAYMGAVKAQAMKSDTSTIKFVDGDTIEASGSKGSTTLKRVKDTK